MDEHNPILVSLSSIDGISFSGSNDGFKKYILKNSIINPDTNKYSIGIHLSSCIIPFSFYCLSSTLGNNKLNYTEITSSGSFNDSITIDDGNYTILTLLAFIKSNLETKSSTASRNFVYNLSYNEDTNKCTFLLTSGTNAISTTFNFSASDNCFKELGFSSDDISFSTSSSATSDRVVNLTGGVSEIHVNVKNLSCKNILSNGGQLSSMIDIIPIDKSPNSIIHYSPREPFMSIIPNDVINEIDISLETKYGKIVDFNACNYTLQLHIKFIKKTRDPHHTISASNLTDTQRELLINKLKQIEDKSKARSKLIADVNKETIKKLLELKNENATPKS